MSRPLLSENRFTTRDLAVVGELSPRNVALLIDQGLAPNPMNGASGRGSHRSYDSVALGQMTLLGALHQAGMELLVAARLARMMTEEYTSIYGRLPSNLGTYLQAPFNPRPGYRPWDSELPEIDLDDDYWLHNRLRFHSKLYHPWTALRGDLIVEIVNQAFVLTSSHDLPIAILSPVNDPIPASPEYRIEGRGSSARVVPITEGIESFDFSTHVDSAELYRDRQNEYLEARKNAVTCLRINVGLGLRNGLDRLADDRLERAKSA